MSNHRTESPTTHRTQSNILRIVIVFVIGVAVVVMVVAYLFIRAELLERRFRNIHTDETEARLLEVVGAPTAIRTCDEGRYKIPKDHRPGARNCARVYWYNAYFFQDGWIVPIDEAGTIMQINRLGLP